MKLLFYFIIGIFLIIAQATIVPHIHFFDHMYDLLIPIVIHAAVFRTLGESLFLVILLGALMDNLSSAPAGFYLTFYVWILIGVRYLKLFLYVGTLSLVTFLVLIAVVIESLALMGLVAVNNLMTATSVNAFRFVLTEVLWAMLSAPLLLAGLNLLLIKLPILRNRFSPARRDEIKRR